ncbi:hypothetical protein [Streptococcus anginosus]|uniref:DUF2292 domain-containing protein n=1 Tax=Streptococcus anginosus TaxID=1328 RepID=A0ABT3E955_STRAP|nr:hypothetical protein [Streptococcus anginosus]MCW1041963.1 hypothetical protein [Streptococcus anginosus]
MTENSDKKILKMMEKGFVLFLKNGIIERVAVPEHGSIEFKVQDGQIVYGTVSAGKQY